MMEKRNQHIHPRVIVFLLLDGSGAINTIKFKYDQYIGDPINLVRIFNHKEADEMVITSKTASKVGIDFKVLGDIKFNSLNKLETNTSFRPCLASFKKSLN